MAANTVSKTDLNREEQNIDEQLVDRTGPSTGGRRRSPTLLKLQWLAERLRKVERIKRQVAEGSYHVDSTEIAKAMLNMHENQLQYPSPAELLAESEEEI